MTLDRHRTRAAELSARLTAARAVAANARTSYDKASELAADTRDAHAVVQEVAELVQASVHDRITKVVSKCLAAVFDQPYTFRIEVKKARGKVEATPVFERGGLVVRDILFEGGGGVADVAAFALRVVCLSMRKGGRKLLVADEPFRFLNGENYQSRVANMINILAAETGFQFIFCSDDPWLEIGNVIRL
jgi:hypothetical protein